MEKNNILKIAILVDGRLGVFPEKKDGSFQHVYREAACVYWDSELDCFKSTEIREWSYAEWYQHILRIVASGLGVLLLMTPETEIESRGDFETQIRTADMEFHR